MNFFDNYYETGSKIKSKAARQEFFAAIIEYYYSGGSEPHFKYESAEVGFTSVRISLDKSLRNSKNKRKTKREGNSNETQTKEEEKSNSFGKNIFLSSSLLSSNTFKEECNSFPVECLGVLNDVLGTAYATLPSAAERTLLRFSETYSLDDVRRMVEFKRDQWRGDARMKHNLTPNTLFSPDHFEQYIHQSREVTTHEFDVYSAKEFSPATI